VAADLKPAVDGKGGGDDFDLHVSSGLTQPLSEAGEAGLDRQRRVGVADERDPAVPEGQEMVGLQAAASNVVDCD